MADDEVDTSDDWEDGPDDGIEDLGAAAARVAGDYQGSLPGTDTVQMKFVGMAWDLLNRPDLKSTGAVVVDYVVVGHAEDVMKDGSIRTIAKAKVTGVRAVGDADAG